jgi:predicted N-acyltransferase
MHYVVDPKFRGAVERHLAQEREMISLKRSALLEKSQLKRDREME